MGSEVRLGGPAFGAARAGEDARLGLAGVGAQVGHQLGAQHEAPLAVLAAEGALRGVDRLDVVAQAVARGEGLAALLALVPHLAQPVHGCHVELQLEVARELLLALAARVQRSWRVRVGCPFSLRLLADRAWLGLGLGLSPLRLRLGGRFHGRLAAKRGLLLLNSTGLEWLGGVWLVVGVFRLPASTVDCQKVGASY